MKRRITGILLSLTFLLAGCGAADTQPPETTVAKEAGTAVTEAVEAAAETEVREDTQAEPETDTQETPQAGSDTLVVYFSRTGEQYGVGTIEKGNTEIVAKMIIEATGADVFEIVPQEDYYPYTYQELTDIAKQEQSENARPAYDGTLPDLSQYQTIFFGAPVWWGDWPMILYTVFEENADALAGKTLIPFSTHGGSGLAGFDKKLAAVCPNSTIGEGLAIPGSDAQNDRDSVQDRVNEWLAALGF